MADPNFRVFEGWTEEIMRRLGATPVKKLGQEYHLVRMADPGCCGGGRSDVCALESAGAAQLAVLSAEDGGFRERAAQALWRKFGAMKPQTVQVGCCIRGAHPYYKHLAVNLRGRTMQLFPPLTYPRRMWRGRIRTRRRCFACREGRSFRRHAESRGLERILSGRHQICQPQHSGTISRAGAKIASHCTIFCCTAAWCRARGIGWSWGRSRRDDFRIAARGITSRRWTRAARRASRPRAGFDICRAGVADFLAPTGRFMMPCWCDLNGDARDSIRHVMRLSRHLKRDGLVVFTLKMPGIDSVEDAVGWAAR